MYIYLKKIVNVIAQKILCEREGVQFRWDVTSAAGIYIISPRSAYFVASFINGKIVPA